jgi:hypothetical protein
LGVDIFLDGPNGRPKDVVHLVFAGEKVQPNYVTAAPDVTESEGAVQFQVVSLDALVEMKLNSFRLKVRVHLLDLMDVGLVDATWPARLPPELTVRLQRLQDHPDA